MKLNTLNENQKLFALFVGRSGSGKTVAAASMPKPLQELDFDMRANGIVNAVNQGWLSDQDIDVIRFDAFKGIIPVQTHLQLLYTFAETKNLQFASIDLGSLTSLDRLLIRTSLSINSKGTGIGHVNLAGLNMTGYGDYRFETQAMHYIMDHLRMLPCHITISAHIINQYGKKPGAEAAAPAEIIGEKLTLSANIAETILAIFNDVYKFTKEVLNGTEKYYVEFNSEISKNSFGISPGRYDITKKNFWDEFQKIKKGEIKPSTSTGNFLNL